MSKKTFIWAMVGLILLRFFLIILMMNNIPFTDMQLGGFRPHFNESYQSDEGDYFNIAEGLIMGQARNAAESLGAPIFFIPIIYLTQAKFPIDIAKPVFIFQTFILFLIALILVARIAKRLFDSKKIAAMAAFIFVVYPWLLLAFGKIIQYRSIIPAFHYQLWILIASDYISALFVYFAFFVLFNKFSAFHGDGDIKLKYVVALSLISAMALLTRVTNIWVFLIILASFLYFKKFKNAIQYGFFSFLFYSPQLFYNWKAFGLPWRYGQSVHGITSGSFNLANFWLNFSNFSPTHYFLWFITVTTFFLIISILSFRYLARVNKLWQALVLEGWFWSYLIFYGIFNYPSSLLRYLIPIIPVFIYFAVASVLQLLEHLKHSKNSYL